MKNEKIDRTRREMLKNVVLGAGAILTADALAACAAQPKQGEANVPTQNQPASSQPSPTGQVSTVYPFSLPPLQYAYNALEPHIDEATMRLHHDKHHQTYIDTLNGALKDQPQLHNLTIEELLGRFDQVPEAVKTVVRNHGGGHANHQLFWKIMAPGMTGASPTGALADAINRDFGSFDNLKTQFNDAGAKLFGSGWVFVVMNPASGKLEILPRPNQDSVLLENKPALFGNDVWEHAYYLKYQNKRADYLQAWWNTVNWNYINERLDGIRTGKKQL